MVDVAKVSMFGFPVGTFRWDDQYDVVRFEYDSRLWDADWNPRR